MNRERGASIIIRRLLATIALAASVIAPSRARAQRTPRPLALTRVALDAPHADRWVGRDKVRHFGSSAGIQLMGYGVIRTVAPRTSRKGATVGAAVVTLAAGVGKELLDARRGGVPSLRDLLWDVAGLGAGVGLSLVADRP